jgi:glycosyltransferase involved in cell wall biosynthesis
MIIGIDIRVLGQRRSGIQEYTENLLEKMLALDSSIDFKLFFAGKNSGLPEYDWLRLPNVELKSFNISNRILFYKSRLLNSPQIDQMMGGCDVFFSPHFFLAPLSKETKHVVTFHDLSYLRFPEFFSLRQRLWHSWQMQPEQQARQADRIIAVSESTRRDLIEKYSLLENKVARIYSGISDQIRRPHIEALDEFRKNKRLPKSFVLFLGTIEPRKNVAGVIKAFNYLKSRFNFPDLNLVIAGGKGWLCSEVFMQAYGSPFSSQIFFVEHISDSEREFYYSVAEAFIYPSFFEGFGFPVLEAMACGTPVITSANSSLPEVVGDAGILVDPYNIPQMGNALNSLIKDAELRRILVEKGYKKVQEFSWDDSAQQTLDLLTSLD